MKSDVWMALSDKTRREIIALLNNEDLSAGEIAKHFNLSKPTISHHLAVLKEAELVNAKKEKTSIIYRLNQKVAQELAKAFYFLNLSRGN